MYAIIRTGGKQYRVKEQQIFNVDKVEGEAGNAVDVDVLFIGGVDKPMAGRPIVTGAKVTATIVEQTKGKKIDAFLYKAKKNIRKHWGHRQQLTKIKIESIVAA